MAKVVCMATQLGFVHDDEEIWDDFRSEFLDAWSDASKKPDALFHLQNIRMESDDGLEEYIATFNAILAEVGWVKDQPGTVRLFKDGLMLWLSRKMHQ
jgi:hypothetical protein